MSSYLLQRPTLGNDIEFLDWIRSSRQLSNDSNFEKELRSFMNYFSNVDKDELIEAVDLFWAEFSKNGFTTVSNFWSKRANRDL